MLASMRLMGILGFAACVGLSACAGKLIPRTSILDTDDNRAILDVVEDYHRALEQLDADALLAVVSPRYYEDNGNTDESDDYDYEGLRKQLAEDFQRTKAMKLDLRIDAIEVEDDRAFAELYYKIHAHNAYPAGLQWDTGSDRTRLRFERADGRWLIIAGL